jgi:hypothetical protein
MTRTLAMASVLFAVAGSLSQISVMSSEPLWLIVWGGALIGVSLQLRSGFGRKPASSGARRAQSFGHATLSPVNRKQQALPLLTHVRTAGTEGSAF